MCNCRNHVHTFVCYLRNIADSFRDGSVAAR